jgi:hypothetical protein
MMAKKRFPKTLYVKTEEEGNDTFFVALESVTGCVEVGETAKIGVYQLVGLGEATGVVNAHTKPLKQAKRR